MSRLFYIAAVLLATPLFAQTIYTPEIHIGSATTPSTITVPPVEPIATGEVPQQFVSNVPPADTELLASRHFDFGVSPAEGVELWTHGTMSDASISLGMYARELRARKTQPATPRK